VLLTPPRVEVHWLRVGHCRHPEWVTLRGGRWQPVDFPAHCALIIHPSFGPILYDTGYADHFGEETRTLPNALYRWVTPVQLPIEQQLGSQLSALGVNLEDVGRVLVSHLHADHVAGLRDVPKARFTALRADVIENIGRRGIGAVRRGFLPGLLSDDFDRRLDFADDCDAVDLGTAWSPFTRGYDLLGDGSIIGVPLPGHSPAQLGLVMWNTDGQPVMLVADACWSTRALNENRLPSLIARPMMHNWSRYRATLTDLHGLRCSRPDLQMLPSHCSVAHTAFQATQRESGALVRG